MLTLYHNDMSVCAQKVRMVLCLKTLDWQSVHLDLRAGDQHRAEFIKLNPKSLVPVLNHDGKVITESSVIIEYLEDVFPSPAAFPVDPQLRSRVRWWLLKLDASLHVHVAAISFCLAFRFQVLERYPNDADRAEFIHKIPDPVRRVFMEDVLENGTRSVRFKFAVLAYDQLLEEMATVLADRDCLVDGELTAADIGFIPYLDRLDQLGLAAWWVDKPQLKAWLQRVRASHAYADGVEKWKNPKYLQLMAGLGNTSWEHVCAVLGR